MLYLTKEKIDAPLIMKSLILLTIMLTTIVVSTVIVAKDYIVKKNADAKIVTPQNQDTGHFSDENKAVSNTAVEK